MVALFQARFLACGMSTDLLASLPRSLAGASDRRGVIHRYRSIARGIGLFNGVDFVGEVVPPEANVVAGRRVNPLFGLGLVDAVPDQFLTDLAQFQQDFAPATAGRANVVTDVASGQPRVGGFGWKCQIGTVLTFAKRRGRLGYLIGMGMLPTSWTHTARDRESV
jgi:hypothetical protein